MKSGRKFGRGQGPGVRISRSLFGGADLLTEGETAQFLRVRPDTLRYWRKRSQRRGPPFVKIERRPVRYRLADLEVYLKRRTVRGRPRK